MRVQWLETKQVNVYRYGAGKRGGVFLVFRPFFRPASRMIFLSFCLALSSTVQTHRLFLSLLFLVTVNQTHTNTQKKNMMFVLVSKKKNFFFFFSFTAAAALKKKEN